MPITHFLKKEEGRRTAHTENTASRGRSLSVLLLLISPEGFVQRASDVKTNSGGDPEGKQPETITFMFYFLRTVGTHENTPHSETESSPAIKTRLCGVHD